jgi:hypothetical protein
MPYLCTYPNCSLGDFVFANRDEWYRHEVQLHRRLWSCNADSHESYRDTHEFVDHMRLFHDHDIRGGQLPALSHVFSSTATSPAGDCTLCGKPVDRIKSHVSRHLKQLALFATRQCHYMPESGTADANSDMAQQSHHPSLRSQDLSSGSSVVSKDRTRREPEEDNVLGENMANHANPMSFSSIGTTDATGQPDSDEIDDSAWDYVTPKFQEARAAMKAIDMPTSTDSVEKRVEVATSPKTSINADNYDGDMAVMNPYHQQRPLCGASIGAFNNGEHLPPISLGGIILVDGEPFGLTCHHLLDAPSDDESDDGISTDDRPDQPVLPPNLGVSSSSSSNQAHRTQTEISGSNPWLEKMGAQPGLDIDSNEPAALWDLEFSDDESEVSNEVDDTAKDEVGADSHDFGSDDKSGSDNKSPPEIISTTGDIDGILPGTRDDILITQPAIDDVDESFFQTVESRDQEHLDAHTLGRVYASSGIRRWNRKGIVHEVDWALIKIDPLRLQPYNVVQGGQRFSFGARTESPPPLETPVDRRYYVAEEDEYPVGVADADSLGGMNVHSFGRTTGLQGGVISEAMHSVRIYRRKTFSRSWYVAGGCKFPVSPSDILKKLKYPQLGLEVTQVRG